MLTFQLARILVALIRSVRDTDLNWDASSLNTAIHDEVGKLGVKPKAVLTVLRCQLTGMKVRTSANVIQNSSDLSRVGWPKCHRYHGAPWQR